MSDNETRIAETVYVDEKAIEFFERRLESDLRREFRRLVLLPVMGISLVALAFVAFYWIPKKVPSILTDDERIQRRLAEAASNGLRQKKSEELIHGQVKVLVENDPRLERLVAEATEQKLGDPVWRSVHIQAAATEAVKQQVAPALGDFLSTAEAQELFKRPLNEALEAFFRSSKGKERVGEVVQANLQGSRFRRLVREEVNAALAPVMHDE